MILSLDPNTPPEKSDAFRYGTGDYGGYATSRPIDDEYGLSGQRASGTGLNLAPAPYVTRPGWEMSGRVGPFRWLNNLDGATAMRLGGRVKGQPRMPGMGLFNVGVHYNFE